MAATVKPYVRVSITTVDATGEKSVTSYRYERDPADTLGDWAVAAQLLATEQAALMNGQVISVTVAQDISYPNPTFAAADGSYISVDSSVRTVFAVADGEVKFLSVATPVGSIFQADLETLDLANAAVGTWQSHVVALAVGAHTRLGIDEDSQSLVDIVSGQYNWRRRNHAHKPA